jgi:HK97 family phage portal protein
MPSLPSRFAHWLGGQRTSAPTHTKSSAAAPLIALQSLGAPVWTPRDYAAFAREGFMQNAVVYRCVRMIAEAAASVPLLLYDGDSEIEHAPILDLIRRPNPTQTGTDLLEAWYGYLLVSGNAYLEAVAVNGPSGRETRELYALRPDRMKVVPGADGWPTAYEYTAGGSTVRYTQNAAAGIRPILHQTLFHPLSDHYGMSPIEAASTAIDIHNAASAWNKALLDNSARPSGALVYAAREGRMTPEQFGRLKSELEESFEGARNAGRPMLLEGGLDWKSMSLSPRDMDFLEAKNAAAREIALALGVPPMLLGIPGDNTYANFQEANRTFWRQTVLPLVKRTAQALSGWLASPHALKADMDAVDALTGDRDALWARLQATSFLTDDEKRTAIGYGPKPTAALAQKFTPNHDDRGRFDFAPNGPGESAPDAPVTPDFTDPDNPTPEDASRRRTGPTGTPAQEARLVAATARANDANRRAQELDPTWREPDSVSAPGIEGAIARQEGAARAAEARIADITRDAVPGTNPSWGVNRLTKELYDQGYQLLRPASGNGTIYENPVTGEQVRIMERPDRAYRTDSPQKHFNEYYYRYKPAGGSWGNHITIPDK